MSSENAWDIKGSLQRIDLLRFCYFSLRRIMWLYIPAFCFVLQPLLKYARDADADGYALFAALVPPAILLSVVLLVPYISARRQYNSARFFQEPMQFGFADAGVEVKGPNFSGSLTWVALHAIRETGTAFLIYPSARTAWVLPKRFFEADTEIQKWKDFVAHHLPNQKTFRGLNWFSSLF